MMAVTSTEAKIILSGDNVNGAYVIYRWYSAFCPCEYLADGHGLTAFKVGDQDCCQVRTKQRKMQSELTDLLRQNGGSNKSHIETHSSQVSG